MFMSAAYRWAFLQQVRKVFYNLTVTALSVAAALVIGLIGLLGLIALAVWRFGRIEQRWSAGTMERQPASSG
jgi:nickel/cobalt transporter (NiCoT) family protein